MSSRYAPLTDRQLVHALRRRVWRDFGAGEALPRVVTIDLENYLCVVVDVEDGAGREDVPPFSARSPRDAMEGLLGWYEARDVDAGLAARDLPDVSMLRDLADGTAPYTVQCDPAELGADGRDDVAEVA